MLFIELLKGGERRLSLTLYSRIPIRVGPEVSISKYFKSTKASFFCCGGGGVLGVGLCFCFGVFFGGGVFYTQKKCLMLFFSA